MVIVVMFTRLENRRLKYKVFCSGLSYVTLPLFSIKILIEKRGGHGCPI